MKLAAGSRFGRSCALIGAGLMAASLSGCLSSEDRKQMADSDSVLAPLFKPTTPADAAAWATDPVDADKRARGTNLLANAPFGGADVYLRLYRERITPDATGKYDSSPVLAVACRALGMHGSPDDVPLIVPLTRSPDYIVRLEATRALQRLHNPVAIPALKERMTIDSNAELGVKVTKVEAEPEPDIRAEAASALGQYADRSVLQVLFKGLTDPSLLVNKNALDSLRTLTGNDALPDDLKSWTQWENATKDPFANRRPYVYPVFWREKRWLDYVPFMPAVPNEIASTPAGFSLEQPAESTAKK